MTASAARVAAAAVFTAGRLGAWVGGVLVGLYVVAVGLVWWRERQPPAFGEAGRTGRRREEGQPRTAGRSRRSDTRAALLVLIGVVGMAAGGWLAVAGAEHIVRPFGLRDSVVGLTFVALATTAELLALVWAATRREVEELALAGVLGSATYNATATLGVAALIHPVPNAGLQVQEGLAAAIPAALVASAVGVGRLGGLVLLAVYAGFLALTFTGH